MEYNYDVQWAISAVTCAIDSAPSSDHALGSRCKCRVADADRSDVFSELNLRAKLKQHDVVHDSPGHIAFVHYSALHREALLRIFTSF